MRSAAADRHADRAHEAGLVAAAARVLGRRPADIADVTDLTLPWSTTTRTLLLTLRDGERAVVQHGPATRAGRASIARRIRLGPALRAASPLLGVPEVLGGDPQDPRWPWMVTRHVDGRPGHELLAGDEDARALGSAAGTVAAAMAGLRPGGLRLSRRWAEPAPFTAAATAWLASAGGDLSPAVSAAAAAVIGRIPELLAASPAAVQHGDLAPVNLVIHGGSVAGLLDLEHVRLAPAAFDAAWFRYLVRLHHPERWAAAGPPFLAARGLPDTPAGPGASALLDDLAVLGCLHRAAGCRTGSVERRTWTDRVRDLLGG